MNIQVFNTLNAVKFHLRSDLHVIRKLWHMGTGLMGLYIYYKSGLDSRTMSYILFGVAIFGFIIDLSRLKNDTINKFVMMFMGPFMRESEKTSLSGFPFYSLGVALSLFLFPERIAILSILFLVFSDPISSYFGILYGKDKILPNKSLQGTVAGYLCCYLVTLVYGMIFAEPTIQLLVFAIFGGVIGALSELLSELVDDNLTIPVVSGAGLSFINLFIPLF
ncbi:MAG: phosphatidate cytidylyltransferase [Bacteriovoracaceae bacterium]|jgi:diacylglycerol kinase (CTP)|nr:phosphatidate cytidylyltransferase [Bacteriovoracaceae bacterium]